MLQRGHMLEAAVGEGGALVALGRGVPGELPMEAVVIVVDREAGEGLVGGLGVAPGANIGENTAVFEATHGSAPKYKGQNKVNPTALILSGVLMLRHLGEADAADRLEAAVSAIIAEGKDVTYDMKPHRDDPSAVGTREMGEAIIQRLKAK